MKKLTFCSHFVFCFLSCWMWILIFASMGLTLGCNQSRTGSTSSTTNPVEIASSVSSLEIVEGTTGSALFEIRSALQQDLPIQWFLTTKANPNSSATEQTNTEQTNFSKLSGSVTVPAGSSNFAIDLPSAADGYYTDSIEFQLTVTGTGVANSVVLPISLKDSDGFPALEAFDAYAVKGQSAQVKMKLSHPSRTDLPVQLSVKNLTAEAGVDFDLDFNSITIPANATEAIFEIPTKMVGNAVEKNFELGMKLTDSIGANDKSAANRTIKVILYNSTSDVQIQVGDATVVETEVTASLKVALSRVSSNPLSFDVKLESDTAMVGTDFRALDQTRFTIPPGQNSLTLNVPLIQDSIRNSSNRNFYVSISNLTAGASYARPKGSVTILPRDTIITTPSPAPTPTPSPNSTPAPTPTNAPLPTNTATPTPTLPPHYVNYTIPVPNRYINNLNQDNFTLGGICSEINQLVNFSGALTNSTPCSPSKTFTKSLGFRGLPEGNLTLTANHTEADGTPVPPDNLILFKDTSKPTLSITTPAEGSRSLNGSGAMNITYAGACSEIDETVSITANGGAPSAAVFCQANSTWMAELDFTTSTNGTLTITANHQDRAGNNADPDTRTVIIDKSFPSVSILLPSVYFYVNSSNQFTFPVSGRCSDIGRDVVLTGIGPVPSASITTTATCQGTTSGSYSASLDLHFLQDGGVTLTANLTNAVGRAAFPASIEGWKDTTPPSVSITSPPADSYISRANRNSFTVGGDCSEDGKLVAFAGAASGSITCIGGHFSKSLAIGADDGMSVSIGVNHQDVAHNTASHTRSFKKDTGAPSFTLTNPIDGFQVNTSNVGSVAFSGSCSDDNENIVFDIYPQYAGPTPIPCQGGTFSSTFSLNDKPDGSITVTANYSDAAGNSAPPIQRVLSKLLAVPNLTFDSPATLYVNASAASNFPISGGCSAINQTIFIGGSTSGQSICGGSGTWQVYLSFAASVPEGQVTITAAMSNLAGNPAPTPAPLILTKDTAAPTPPPNLDFPAIYSSASQSPVLSWSFPAVDTTSTIARYEIAVGTTPGARNVRDWYPVGNSNSGYSPGLTLTDTASYYPSVRAIDAAGNASTAKSSATPWTVQLVPTATPTPTVTPTPTATPTPTTAPAPCPTGYISVQPLPVEIRPAGYPSSQFCVMQFEARNDGFSKATSVPAAAPTPPWEGVTHANSKIACAANNSPGTNDYALITNAEWQTVARTIEMDKDNWSSGQVGNGMINTGYPNSNISVLNLADPYDQTGGAPGSEKKRTHKLPYGEIWDLAGNLAEFVYETNTNSISYPSTLILSNMTATSPSSTFTLGFVTGTAKTLFGPHNTYSGNTGLTSFGGLGEVVVTNESNRPIILRGVSFYVTFSGAFGIFSTNTLDASGYNGVGFRCVYHPAPTCPDANYIPVRYMAPYTQNDFCVAKYEARVVGSKGISKPEGSPSVTITRDAAQAACVANGAKYRLITNGEWQTVARTIEAQTTNWIGGVVGSGTLVRGWANYNPGLAPDSLDAHNYNSDSNTGSTSGALVYRRTHNIIYGDIWDFGGNAYEWVLSDNTNGSPFGTSGYINTFTASIPAFSGPIDFVEGTAKLHFGPSGTAYSSLSPAHGGMGYATFGNSSSAIIRGGGYTESPTVHGIFSADTTNDKSTTRSDLGFRCVYYP